MPNAWNCCGRIDSMITLVAPPLERGGRLLERRDGGRVVGRGEVVADRLEAVGGRARELVDVERPAGRQRAADEFEGLARLLAAHGGLDVRRRDGELGIFGDQLTVALPPGALDRFERGAVDDDVAELAVPGLGEGGIRLLGRGAHRLGQQAEFLLAHGVEDRAIVDRPM